MKFMSADKNHIVETTHIQVKEIHNVPQIDGSVKSMFCIIDRNHFDEIGPVKLSEMVYSRKEAQDALAAISMCNAMVQRRGNIICD